MKTEIKKAPKWMVIQLDHDMLGEGETRDEAVQNAAEWGNISIAELESQLVDEKALQNFSGDVIVTEDEEIIAEYS